MLNKLKRLPVYLKLDAPLPFTVAENTRKPVKAVETKDKTIVFQAVFSPALAVAQEDGPWRSRPSQLARFTEDRAKIRLYVYNFSNSSFSITSVYNTSGSGTNS